MARIAVGLKPKDPVRQGRRPGLVVGTHGAQDGSESGRCLYQAKRSTGVRQFIPESNARLGSGIDVSRGVSPIAPAQQLPPVVPSMRFQARRNSLWHQFLTFRPAGQVNASAFFLRTNSRLQRVGTGDKPASSNEGIKYPLIQRSIVNDDLDHDTHPVSDLVVLVPSQSRWQ